MSLLKFSALVASAILVPYIVNRYTHEAVPVETDDNLRYDIDDCMTEDEL